MFKELIVQQYADWKLIFTDACKADFYTSFAIVDSIGNTIKSGQLPNYCSVYTAEAAAIYNALPLARDYNTKTLICTDSKSTISALLNGTNKSYLISKIRNILIANRNIKIMWVPGHAGITGNEWADHNAKLAAKQPLIVFDYIEKEDIFRLIASQEKAVIVNAWKKFATPLRHLQSERE